MWTPLLSLVEKNWILLSPGLFCLHCSTGGHCHLHTDLSHTQVHCLLFVCRIPQFFSMAIRIGGRFRLKVVMNFSFLSFVFSSILNLFFVSRLSETLTSSNGSIMQIGLSRSKDKVLQMNFLLLHVSSGP